MYSVQVTLKVVVYDILEVALDRERLCHEEYFPFEVDTLDELEGSVAGVLSAMSQIAVEKVSAIGTEGGRNGKG